MQCTATYLNARRPAHALSRDLFLPLTFSPLFLSFVLGKDMDRITLGVKASWTPGRHLSCAILCCPLLTFSHHMPFYSNGQGP